MELLNRIDEDMKDAMRAKDVIRRDTLRGVKKEFTDAKIAKTPSADLTETEAITILQRMAKQRRDSAAIYKEQNRDDLADKEIEEVGVIEQYLPKQLSEAELEVKVKALIEKLGASSMADMGKVMGVATKELAGVAAGKAISDTVKKLLS